MADERIDEVQLRHGYTLTDLRAIARLAVNTAGAMAADWHDRYDTAFSGIAEALYAAEHWPARHDLESAGKRAVWDAVEDLRQAHGYYGGTRETAGRGPATGPQFLAYWWDLCGAVPSGSPEPKIVERLALHAIWPKLTPGQQDALLALAVHQDYHAAAAALEMQYKSFLSMLTQGRTRFRRWWHEGEQPSTMWGCDRRAGSTAGSRHAAGSANTSCAAIRRRARKARKAAA